VAVVTRKAESRCGTPSGYDRHQRVGEKPCAACANATADYDKRWRDATKRRQRDRLHARAQGRAEKLLRLAHPNEYDAYYQIAKAEVQREAEATP
jgi:hypothetical protein